jgi:hypothetical protein
MQIDQSAWSGDGDFTIRLVEALRGIDEIAFLRIEDAPASHSDSGYSLLANELYVAFATERRPRVERWLRLIPRTRAVDVPRLTLAGLGSRLASIDGIGEADYVDDGMLQYLRTERIVAPYQTRGYKLVELVRVYTVSGEGTAGPPQPCPGSAARQGRGTSGS